jgi:serine/threonine-protein kinase
MNDLTGQTVRGYELQQKIGQGGQSTVYKAYQPSQQRFVAVRLMHPENLTDPDMVRRFQMEAVIFFRLKHPHIVPLYDYWSDNRGIWIVQRWMAGGSLRQSLQKSGAWSLERTATMLDQICSALNFVHNKAIIHRDLKPDNILFDEEGKACVHDFGIAKRIHATDQTLPEMMVGSPAYSAPEQLRKDTISAQTDIYILGVTLYETLTAQHPFHDARTKMQMALSHLQIPLPFIRETHPDIPPAVDSVIQKATAKRPEDRYPDVLTLAQAFREAISGQI